MFAFVVGKGLRRHGGERLDLPVIEGLQDQSVLSCWLQSKDLILWEGEEAMHVLKDVLEANRLEKAAKLSRGSEEKHMKVQTSPECSTYRLSLHFLPGE